MIDVAIIPLKDIKGICTTIEQAEEPFNEQVHFEIASEIYIIDFLLESRPVMFQSGKKPALQVNQN